MKNFEHIIGKIYRLKIPFEDIFTSVFVIISYGKTVLFDTGTNEYDVKTYILPALKKNGFLPDIIVISHFHGDHGGGCEAIAKEFPSAKICAFGENLAKEHKNFSYHRLSDKEEICSGVEVWNLKGHTDDCAAIFDKTTKTVISGDCFQLCGISRFGCAVCDKEKYLKSIDRVLKSDADNLVASHEYVPLGAAAFGRENTEEYLTGCRIYFEKIGIFVREHKNKKLEEIVTLYNRNSGLPPVPQGTFETFVDF